MPLLNSLDLMIGDRQGILRMGRNKKLVPS